MKINRIGITRIIFIFNRFVIKIPNFSCNHHHFLQGCYANRSERRFYKIFKGMHDQRYYQLVCPSYYCSWFGLFQIQARCLPLERKLTRDEYEKFKGIAHNDMKKENFGFHKDRLVCLNYA